MKRIPKIPQGEISSIKNILYPDLKPKDKKFEVKNIHNIKKLEEKNRKLKEEKEKNTQNDLYKINKYKSIPPKLKIETNNILNNEKKVINPPRTPLNKEIKRGNSIQNPPISDNKNRPYALPQIGKEDENIYNLLNNKKESMFDKYYSNMNRSKTPSLIKHINNNINPEKQNINIINNFNPLTPFKENESIYNINNENYNLNNNISQKYNSSEIHNSSSNDYDKSNNLNEPKVKDSKEIERLILEYKIKYGMDEALENMIKDYSKNKQNLNNNNNLNSITEVEEKLESTTKKKNNILLPKIQKNYIRENKKLIVENKIPIKHKNVEEKNNNIKHKNYGKVPSYIKKYELEREIKKEEIKRQKEAEKIPKGTKLLSEEERINTLNGLINSKKELINQLEKMPITTRTIAIQNKKDELIHRLEELEKGIEMFSKKQVFIQV